MLSRFGRPLDRNAIIVVKMWPPGRSIYPAGANDAGVVISEIGRGMEISPERVYGLSAWGPC
jgi:hypothetical protein